MNEVEVIKEVRSIITAGWHKGAYEDGDGNCCILGALRKVRHPREDIGTAEEALSSHVPNAESCAPGEHPLVVYNDDESTTLQDMLDLCDKTLASLGGLG